MKVRQLKGVLLLFLALGFVWACRRVPELVEPHFDWPQDAGVRDAGTDANLDGQLQSSEVKKGLYW